MLNIGEKVFIADYGAGYVTDIDGSELYFDKGKYMKIYLLLDNMKLMIPIEKIRNYKIRNISSKIELETNLNIISKESDYIESNWNNRYRINKKKIQSGSLTKMCQVIRDLYHLKKKNMLPPGEAKFLKKVEGMLASEIMLIIGSNMEEALCKIRN